MGEAKRRKAIQGDRYGKIKKFENQPNDLEIQAWLTSSQVLNWVEQTIGTQAPDWNVMMTQLLQEVLKDKTHDHIICDPTYSVAVGVDAGNWSLWAGIHGRNRSLDAFSDCPFKVPSSLPT